MSVLFLYPNVGTYIMYLHAQIVKKNVDEFMNQFGMDLSNELE